MKEKILKNIIWKKEHILFVKYVKFWIKEVEFEEYKKRNLEWFRKIWRKWEYMKEKASLEVE